MFFSSRISLRQLAGLCRRLATALGAGLDVRTVWSREVERATGRTRNRFAAVSRAVDRGESVADGLDAAGGFFPPLFRELTEVGERTGNLSEVFVHLADHYQGQLDLRRNFLAAVAWPMTQLALAVVIIGFLIWIMGPISEMADHPIYPLGFGLNGTRGLLIYVVFLALVATLGFLLVRAARRGLVWTRPIQRAVSRLPVLGGALRTMALARLAWSLHLTMGAGMELRRALRLSLRSTGSAPYTDRIGQIDAEIAEGNSIHEAFLAARCFPEDFLDTLAVGEESGKLVESMARLSRQYGERARAALATLNMLAGFAIWGVIAAIIIALIFRLAMTLWFGVYDDLLP